MTDNNSYELQNSKQAQQVVYGYPVPIGYSDEIDLGDLLFKLASQYKLIFLIVAVGTLMSVLLALSLNNVYRQEVIISQPSEADIADLNVYGIDRYNPVESFRRYYDALRSQEIISSYLIDNELIKKLYPDSGLTISQKISEFSESFLVNVIEPLPNEKNGLVEFPQRLELTAEHSNEKVLSDVLNGYIVYTQSLLLESIAAEQRSHIASKIDGIDNKISLLRDEEKKLREFRIERIELENKTRIANLEVEIKSLLSSAELDRSHDIVLVKEALKMSTKLNIKKPTYLSQLSKGDTSAATEINLAAQQELPLYLMGTNYLQARLQELEERKNNEPYVEELENLYVQIDLIKNDATLAELKNRKSDDPFIEEFPGLISQKAELNAATFSFKDVRFYRLDKKALPIGKLVRPDKKLIVITGFVLSSLVAFCVALIVVILTGRKAKSVSIGAEK